MNLLVLSDSQLMVEQLRGNYRVKNRDLQQMVNRVRQLRRQFKHVRFEHVPREHNLLADDLAGKALADHERQAKSSS